MSNGDERARVADFWDDVLKRWESGDTPDSAPLKEWFESYSGVGAGQVDLGQYPDPYAGDLRGLEAEPRLVLLGLNPGVGYDELQGADGVWTRRIKDSSYSTCLERSPAEDPATWLPVHGKRSPYWVKLIYFVRRWLQDSSLDYRQVLNMELYPWHSRKWVGQFQPPLDVVDDFVWKPIQEIDVRHVFAFGSKWFDVVDGLQLPVVARFGKGGTPLLEDDTSHWRVAVHELPSGQRVVVSSQAGSSNPPGAERVEILRGALMSL